MLKINLGCGTNRLHGWENHDDDVDITQRLPWDDGVADFILAEHVVEHVHYEQAIGFFRECHRILRNGGVCRIAVPSVTRVMKLATRDYCEFAKKWAGAPDTSGMSPVAADRVRRRHAMTNILFMHGHKAPWTEELLSATLFYAGFGDQRVCAPGHSPYPELQGIEGHGKIIGEEFNFIETVVVEATKLGDQDG